MDEQVEAPPGSFDRALLRLERITMSALSGLREELLDELDGARQETREELRRLDERYMPASRVTDRWKQDDRAYQTLEADIASLKVETRQVAQTMPSLATKADIAALLAEKLADFERNHPTTTAVQSMIAREVKEHTGKFVTVDQVGDAIRSAQAGRWTDIRTTVTWIIGILAFLYATGLIHPIQLFGGK
jgi:hypothetical protein